MKMLITNYDMTTKIDQLSKYLDRVDIIGYAAARNIRRLEDSAMEFIKRRNEVLAKYGDVERDENGNDTGKRYITENSFHYNDVMDALNDIGEIKHEVEIFTIPYETVNGVLSGSDILELDWMFTD